MTLIRTIRAVSGYWLLCVGCVLVGVACSSPANFANTEMKPTTANSPIAAKPAATEAKQPDTKPAGKEVVPADGPKLKSLKPAEGTILVGVLNDIAISVPKPEAPADAKATGTVTIEVMVNEKGEVVASSAVGGPQPLWSAAAAAARKAQFAPPLKDGKPVKIAGVLTFEFGK